MRGGQRERGGGQTGRGERPMSEEFNHSKTTLPWGSTFRSSQCRETDAPEPQIISCLRYTVKMDCYYIAFFHQAGHPSAKIKALSARKQQ